MKQLNIRPAARFLFVAAFSTIFFACDRHSDEEIREDITEKLGEQYKNITPEVSNGIVTLTGSCEGDDCAGQIERLITDVEGVDSVRNNIQGLTNTDLTLRTSVQAIVSKYQGVKADVVNGNVVLRGSILRDQVQPLLTELEMLRPKSIDNQLAMQ